METLKPFSQMPIITFAQLWMPVVILNPSEFKGYVFPSHLLEKEGKYDDYDYAWARPEDKKLFYPAAASVLTYITANNWSYNTFRRYLLTGVRPVPAQIEIICDATHQAWLANILTKRNILAKIPNYQHSMLYKHISLLTSQKQRVA